MVLTLRNWCGYTTLQPRSGSRGSFAGLMSATLSPALALTLIVWLYGTNAPRVVQSEPAGDRVLSHDTS